LIPVKFTKRLVSSDIFESVGVFDIDGDGVLDLVFGTEWYQGPDFVNRHPIGEIERIHDYYDDFADIPMDINGNGRLDYVTASFFSPALRWRENPGKWDDPWPEHVICEIGASETTRAWDVDGDGQCELITGKRYRAHCGRDPGANDDLGIYYFKWNGQSFSKQVISYGPLGVGAGIGLCFELADLRGTGRLDLVAPGKDGLYIFYNEGS